MKGHGRITRPKKKKKEEIGNLPKKEKKLQSNDSKDDAKLGNKMEMQINKTEAQIQKTKQMFSKDLEEIKNRQLANNNNKNTEIKKYSRGNL